MSKSVQEIENIRVLKSGSCPSLSGKSKLSYQIGCDENAALFLRIAGNTGAGFFSDDWLPLSGIDKVVLGPGAKKGLTSATLRALFPGKSVNTAGFVLAALKHEGAIAAHEENRRQYQATGFKAFVAAVQDLMQAAPAKGVKTTGGRGKGAAKKAIQKAVTRKVAGSPSEE